MLPAPLDLSESGEDFNAVEEDDDEDDSDIRDDASLCLVALGVAANARGDGRYFDA